MKAKITIEAGAWKKALATLNTVVSSRTALPILGDVLLRYDAEQKLFQLTASDNESWLTLDCRHDADTPWIHIIEDDQRDRFSAVCLPFARLKEAIAADDLETEKQMMITSTERRKFFLINYGLKFTFRQSTFKILRN